MSDPESFLARWSRLKREQGARAATEDAPATEAAVPDVDLASLPPIESLGPGSDVSAYLGAGVPAELTQAALRSAWRNDPTIREFVEIADNQWDFNEPEGVPGFGLLGAAEEARRLVAQAMGAVEKTTAALLAPEDGTPGNRMVLVESRVVDSVWQAGVASLPRVEQTSTETPAASEAPGSGRRLHGSALPK